MSFNLFRAHLQEKEMEIIQRSHAAEMRWSSRGQESITGQTRLYVAHIFDGVVKPPRLDEVYLVGILIKYYVVLCIF